MLKRIHVTCHEYFVTVKNVSDLLGQTGHLRQQLSLAKSGKTAFCRATLEMIVAPKGTRLSILDEGTTAAYAPREACGAGSRRRHLPPVERQVKPRAASLKK